MPDNVTNPKEYPFPAPESSKFVDEARMAEQALTRFLHHARERVSILMEVVNELALDLDTARSKLRAMEDSRDLWQAVALLAASVAVVEFFLLVITVV